MAIYQFPPSYVSVHAVSLPWAKNPERTLKYMSVFAYRYIMYNKLSLFTFFIACRLHLEHTTELPHTVSQV